MFINRLLYSSILFRGAISQKGYYTVHSHNMTFEERKTTAQLFYFTGNTY